MSRKLAKENPLIPVLISLLVLIPALGYATNDIKTTQKVIVLDPGHGGSDTGLLYSSKIEEKNITLTLAKKTAEVLGIRYNVILTRNDDIILPQEQRVLIGNKNKADLYISLHSHKSDTISGYFYYFKLPTHSILPKKNNPNTWRYSPLNQLDSSKNLSKIFKFHFSKTNVGKIYIANGLPLLTLEGTAMPAVQIEPLSISHFSKDPAEVETTVKRIAIKILNSIDLFFKKKRYYK